MAKKRQKSVLGLALGNRPLIVSLNAKLNACVGKYLSHAGTVSVGFLQPYPNPQIQVMVHSRPF